MCLIGVFIGQATDPWALVMAANRDEAFARPTKPAGWWQLDGVDVFGGQDLVAGGTWMALTKRGRWAALTNVRQPWKPASLGPSRGSLVTSALAQPHPWQPNKPELYAGYNLLQGRFDAQGNALVELGSNQALHSQQLLPGLSMVSNGVMLSQWPKAKKLQALMSTAISANAQAQPLTTALFTCLADQSPALDADLPDTGVGLAMERALSPINIRGDLYGTRVSTVMLVDWQQRCWYSELSRQQPNELRQLHTQLGIA
jgi:uncharacterized protein with NRDE domain